MYKQDLEQTLLGIDEEAELEIGPRDDRPSVVLVGGSFHAKRCDESVGYT